MEDTEIMEYLVRNYSLDILKRTDDIVIYLLQLIEEYSEKYDEPIENNFKILRINRINSYGICGVLKELVCDKIISESDKTNCKNILQDIFLNMPKEKQLLLNCTITEGIFWFAFGWKNRYKFLIHSKLILQETIKRRI